MKRKEKPKVAFDVKEFLTKANGGRTIADCGENALIFPQGDPADAVFYVQKGKVKLTVLSRHGKEAVVAILGTGDFFGEGCLAGQSVRMATATAMTDCSVMRLEKAAVVILLHEEPAFAELFVAHSGTPSLPKHQDRRGSGGSIIQFQ